MTCLLALQFRACQVVAVTYNICLHADVAQLVEHNLAKVGVAGSNPVIRSIEFCEQELPARFLLPAQWLDSRVYNIRHEILE